MSKSDDARRPLFRFIQIWPPALKVFVLSRQAGRAGPACQPMEQDEDGAGAAAHSCRGGRATQIPFGRARHFARQQTRTPFRSGGSLTIEVRAIAWDPSGAPTWPASSMVRSKVWRPEPAANGAAAGARPAAATMGATKLIRPALAARARPANDKRFGIAPKRLSRLAEAVGLGKLARRRDS